MSIHGWWWWCSNVHIRHADQCITIIYITKIITKQSTWNNNQKIYFAMKHWTRETCVAWEKLRVLWQFWGQYTFVAAILGNSVCVWQTLQISCTFGIVLLLHFFRTFQEMANYGELLTSTTPASRFLRTLDSWNLRKWCLPTSVGQAEVQSAPRNRIKKSTTCCYSAQNQQLAKGVHK